MPSDSRGAVAPFADATDFEFLTAFASRLLAIHDSLLALREACERHPYNPEAGGAADAAVGATVEALKSSGLRGRRLIDLAKELADVAPSDWGAPFSEELARLDWRAIPFDERLYPIRNRLGRANLMLDAIRGDSRPVASSPTKPSETNTARRAKGANAEVKMLRETQTNLESHGWTAVRWANFLGVSAGTVKGYQTWKSLIRNRKMEAERRSVPKPSRRKQGPRTG